MAPSLTCFFGNFFFQFWTFFQKFLLQLVLCLLQNFLASLKLTNDCLLLVKNDFSTQKRHRHGRATPDSSKFFSGPTFSEEIKKMSENGHFGIPGVKFHKSTKTYNMELIRKLLAPRNRKNNEKNFRQKMALGLKIWLKFEKSP